MSDKSLQVSQSARGWIVWPWHVGVAVIDGPVGVAPVVVVVVVVASPTYSVEADVV